MALAFAAALLTSVSIQYWLATRQVRHVVRERRAVPAVFAAIVPLQKHQQAADYTVAKSKFFMLNLAWSALVLVSWTWLGGLDLLNRWVSHWVPSHWGPMGYQLILLGSFGLISNVLEIPWNLYQTFSLEQRFGFNRTSWRLYVSDALKGALVITLVGGLVAWFILSIMGSGRPYWWVELWLGWMLLNVAALWLYPTWIAPLFNRFVALTDEALLLRMRSLLARCGFTVENLWVMNGSQRSTHANAYLTGWGKAKRVVFFDTLLKQLSPAELEAVLAHELGHFKHKHLWQRMLSVATISAAGIGLLAWLSTQTWFFTGLGVQPLMNQPNAALALLLFLLIAPAFAFGLTPFLNRLSRRHEFEADAYACQHADANALGSALLKLHTDNASTLTPDPLYVSFYASHPPASERLAALPGNAFLTGGP